MHLLQIIDSLAWGGAQKLLVTFAEALEGSGDQLTVANLFHKKTDAPYEKDLQALGVQVKNFSAPNLFNMKRINELVRFIRQEQFDLIHSHLSYANILATLTGRMTNTPVVASLHNIKRDKQSATVQRIEDFFLNQWAKRIIAVGHIVADVNQPHYKVKLDIIPNAVPLLPSLSAEEITAIRTELIGDPTRPVIISVGRMAVQKAYHDLIDAYAKVHQQHPEPALLLVGGGGQRPKLEEQVERLNLQEHVFMPGRRSDVPQLLAASDLYVSSSHWEGLPVAVLEAMSAALPIVATDAGDIPHVVTNGTGRVVPIKNVDMLADAIIEFITNPAKMKAAGQEARQRVITNYSPQVWKDQLYEVYNEVVSIR